VFLVPYIQLVFGVEIAVRAFQKDQPFAPRAKWTVSICLTKVGLLTLTTFLVANFQRAKNTCLLSLFWFVAEYAMGCFILLIVIVTTLLACAVIIFVKLHKSIKVEVTARVNASRMVYYLALAAISTVSFRDIPRRLASPLTPIRPFPFPSFLSCPLSSSRRGIPMPSISAWWEPWWRTCPA
jgi:hypothetical protein